MDVYAVLASAFWCVALSITKFPLSAAEQPSAVFWCIEAGSQVPRQFFTSSRKLRIDHNDYSTNHSVIFHVLGFRAPTLFKDIFLYTNISAAVPTHVFISSYRMTLSILQLSR
ncbi:hypothetical protein BU26DRAFT_220262 [Trematosphaeria pertusa]|uniref:Secreted protein n=1 Tax=Trematosphaeria pertusa TaxID=390896 RepID=A0A6A6IRZ0_9PLEO|nr:uncharacterized protein BU26DRAFT_220262 [Trematosphaeria pertusa]KAF2253304.1 hypothetical protein BU26DRAFT_220262 [Trematosphaeria pertusa]